MSQRKRNSGAIRDLEFWINNGNPTFESLTVTGNAAVRGNLTVSGNIVVGGSLTAASLLVTGNAVVNGSLTVSGGITTNALTVTGNVAVNGNMTVSGTLTVEDSITMAGTQIRHPARFGPYSPTASSVELVTGIESWANGVDLTLINISTNGTSNPVLQLGTLTGLVTAGYLGSVNRNNDAAAVVAQNHDNGFKLGAILGAGLSLHGNVFLRRHGTVTSNTWVYSFVGGRSDATSGIHAGGHIVLPGPLVKLAVNTSTGTQVYDGGEIAGSYFY